jgi:hypothetical protein
VDDQPLTSWKAIAQVFGRDIRTVQRWEKEEGLPIRRHLHHRGNSVFAYRSELDAWWQQHAPTVAAASADAVTVASRKPQHRGRWASWLGVAAVAATAVFSLAHEGARPAIPDSRRPASIEVDAARDGVAVRAGDLNGDSRPDLVYGAHGASVLHVVFDAGAIDGPGAGPTSRRLLITTLANGDLAPGDIADYNGDGLGDLVVSTLLREPDSLTRTGATYLMFGRREWPPRLELPTDADVRIELDVPGDRRMGACGAPAADMDGDGLTDLLLKASEYTHAGRLSAGAVMVIAGRRQWPATLDAAVDARTVVAGSRSGEGIGECAAGDVDGDGRAELLAYASQATLFNLRGGGGRLLLFRLPATTALLDAATDALLRVDDPRRSRHYVSPALADVDGDGRADLLFGRRAPEGGSQSGEVRIWFGRPGPVARQDIDHADVVISGGGSADFGDAVMAADLDRDGLRDLLVTDGGSLLLIYGRRDWRPRGNWQEFGGLPLLSTAADRQGALVETDVNADGAPEIIVGTSRTRHGSTGRVRVVYPHRVTRLDVRPDQHPNYVMLRDWPLVVRLFGDDRIDPIDPETIRAAGVRPTEVQERDYDGDGLADVQAVFDTAALDLAPSMQYLTVTGRTRAGWPIVGRDRITVIQAPARP